MLSLYTLQQFKMELKADQMANGPSSMHNIQYTSWSEHLSDDAET